MVREPGQADLLMASVRAEQSRVIGDVLEASLKKMAENRARLAEERAEREREADRLRRVEERERADARALAEKHERRRAYFADLARRGDEWAGVLADREAQDAAAERRKALGSRLDARG
ncbi:MAG TPA: hypothetical protein ENK11_10805 [Phycisphaerales bacterium]|nr:hypothetical protein [Phycisphaerales bacterium]